MAGTFWVNIHGAPIQSVELLGITIADKHKLLDSVFAQDNCPDVTTLSLFGLTDLNLPHGSLTLEIYRAAQTHGAKMLTAGAALRVLAQHPNIFRTTRIDGEAVQSCLIGIEPIIAPNSKKYIIEIGEDANKKFIRFRRADDYISWSNNEWWIFAS